MSQKKNHVARSKAKVSLLSNYVHRRQWNLCLTHDLSYMVGFINYLAQMIIMTRWCVVKKNISLDQRSRSQSALQLASVRPVHVWPITLKMILYKTICCKQCQGHSPHLNFMQRLQWNLFVSDYILGFIYNLAEMTVMALHCVTNKKHVPRSKVKIKVCT